MPPPPIRPPIWNQQPQIPGTDLPPMPSGNAAYPPPPPPGTSVSICFSPVETCHAKHSTFSSTCVSLLFPNHRIGLHHCHRHRHNSSRGAMVPILYHHCQQYRLRRHHRQAVRCIRHHLICLTIKANFHTQS